jgi:hypothetical protein
MHGHQVSWKDNFKKNYENTARVSLFFKEMQQVYEKKYNMRDSCLFG